MIILERKNDGCEHIPGGVWDIISKYSFDEDRHCIGIVFSRYEGDKIIIILGLSCWCFLIMKGYTTAQSFFD